MSLRARNVRTKAYLVFTGYVTVRGRDRQGKVVRSQSSRIGRDPCSVKRRALIYLFPAGVDKTISRVFLCAALFWVLIFFDCCFCFFHSYLVENNIYRSPALAAKLDTEKAVQAAHVKRVKNKLREIKGGLFNDQHKMHKENVDVSAS